MGEESSRPFPKKERADSKGFYYAILNETKDVQLGQVYAESINAAQRVCEWWFGSIGIGFHLVSLQTCLKMRTEGKLKVKAPGRKPKWLMEMEAQGIKKPKRHPSQNFDL